MTKDQTIDRIIGTHEALETKLMGLQAQYEALEQWAARPVDLLIELNAILIEPGGTPASKINQILDDYFEITAISAHQNPAAKTTK